MNILILGGTKFLGRALVEAARARGHTLTLFNRGKQDPTAFPDVEQVHGDRTLPPDDAGVFGALFARDAGRAWDAVVDTAAYLPRDVRAAAEVFGGRTGHFTFVSSISALASHARPGQDESSPAAELTDAQRVEVDAIPVGTALTSAQLGELYGPLKAECERLVIEAFGPRALVVRPGLIVGPYDPSERFTYWPVRMMRGGNVLAPGRPARGITFIDVRDLAEWMVRLIEGKQGGTYMASGPARPAPIGAVLEVCEHVAHERGAPTARLVWAPDEWLLAHKVGPWMELPLWIPEFDPDSAGFFGEDCSKARAAGLTFRPLEDTVRATLDWALARPQGEKGPAGMPPDTEARLLAEISHS
jgi:2'-hydroxyisoflavone reductase